MLVPHAMNADVSHQDLQAPRSLHVRGWPAHVAHLLLVDVACSSSCMRQRCSVLTRTRLRPVFTRRLRWPASLLQLARRSGCCSRTSAGQLTPRVRMPASTFWGGQIWSVLCGRSRAPVLVQAWMPVASAQIQKQRHWRRRTSLQRLPHQHLRLMWVAAAAPTMLTSWRHWQHLRTPPCTWSRRCACTVTRCWKPTGRSNTRPRRRPCARTWSS